MKDVTNETRPSTVLRDEHQVILRVINVLERVVARSESGDGFEVDALRDCVEFFRYFADACHHAKEEDLLFPAMEQRGIPREGGPIGVMLYEHRQARGFVQEMDEALDALDMDEAEAKRRFRAAARQYIKLLRQHIDKEDHCLFAMADSALTNEDQRTLCREFCEVACRSFGGHKREALERRADALEARWSV